MQTPIDFGKDFLYRLYDQRDADACQKMLAGDLVWITPEDMHHFLSEGAVLKFLRKQIREAREARYVDLISIKSSPSADNMMTVAYEINLVSREEEKPLYLRCSMVICRRSRRLEITFLHFSTRTERDSSEQLRDFVTNLPCGVMILACLDGRREEAIFYNEYFAHRLRYRQEEFARAMARNPFFMASEEDRDRLHEEIAKARKNGGNIAASLRFYRRDGNSFYYRMLGAPAYQADGGTVYYCVFQETTGFQLTADRLQSRLDTATGILRQIPEAICGIEYPPEGGADRGTAGGKTASREDDADGDVKIYRNKRDKKSADAPRAGHSPRTGGTPRSPRVFFTSKNIPALFGVSNSAYMKNILQDPFYGLEITSITRDRLLAARILDPGQAGPAGPVSCGIFRLRRRDALLQSTAASAQKLPDPAEVPAPSESAETRPGTSPDQEADRDPAAKADVEIVRKSRAYSSADPESIPAGKTASVSEAPRVELVVRRVREKDGTVRIYLFYYDREAQQQDLENRVDRAMKMGRAGQDQLRADLRKAKEAAGRRQSELNAALQQAQEKSAVDLTRAENQLQEEKKRAVLLARQLEEARAEQKRLAGDLEKAREDADYTVRSIRARADRKIREAEEKAKETERQIVRVAEEKADTIEQQAKEARERAERQIAEAERRADEARKEARRRIEEAEQQAKRRIEEAEQQARQAQKNAGRKEGEASAARDLLEEQLREAQERNRLLEDQLRSERARRMLAEEQVQAGSRLSKTIQDRGQKEDFGKTISAVPARSGDWMTAEEPLTVFSAMDPALSARTGQAIISGNLQPAMKAQTRPVSNAQARQSLKAQTQPVSKAQARQSLKAQTQPVSNAQARQSLKAQARPAVSPAAEPALTAALHALPETAEPALTAALHSSPEAAESVTAAAEPGPLTDDPSELLKDQNPADLIDRFWQVEKRIRAREDEKARRRLRTLMEKADSFIQNADTAPERAGAEKPAAKNTAAERTVTQKPAEEKTVTQKPVEEKTGGEKTDGEKTAAEKTAAEKAAGGKSSGGTASGYQTPCTRENIRGIMNDFLEASSSGQALLQAKTFSPETFLQNILVYEGMACADRGISLRLFRDSRLPAEVTGFEALLQRALCEILENAIAHTPQGGVISIHCRADRPSAGLVNLYFRIDDNGSGIPSSRMQTIFEASQPEETGEPVHSGLFAAREAATLMGGSIHARSGRDGTRFSLNVALRVGADA